MMTPFDESLLTAYLDDELSSEERQAVEDQLATNPRLCEMLQELKHVRALVSKISDATLTRNLAQSVMDTVNATPMQETTLTLSPTTDRETTNSPTPSAFPIPRRWLSFAAGLAAVILLVWNLRLNEPFGLQDRISMAPGESGGSPGGEPKSSVPLGVAREDAYGASADSKPRFESMEAEAGLSMPALAEDLPAENLRAENLTTEAPPPARRHATDSIPNDNAEGSKKIADATTEFFSTTRENQVDPQPSRAMLGKNVEQPRDEFNSGFGQPIGQSPNSGPPGGTAGGGRLAGDGLAGGGIAVDGKPAAGSRDVPSRPESFMRNKAKEAGQAVPPRVATETRRLNKPIESSLFDNWERIGPPTLEPGTKKSLSTLDADANVADANAPEKNVAEKAAAEKDSLERDGQTPSHAPTVTGSMKNEISLWKQLTTEEWNQLVQQLDVGGYLEPASSDERTAARGRSLTLGQGAAHPPKRPPTLENPPLLPDDLKRWYRIVMPLEATKP